MSRAIFFLTFIIAGALALAFAPAFAQPATWNQANDRCVGEPLLRTTGKANPACRQRDDISLALIKQGWLPCAHGVWLSPEQQKWFSEVLVRIDGQARDNLYAADSLIPVLLIELRRRLSDAQIFAVWNEQRPAVQAYVPFASSLMTVMLQKLSLTYARSNDPRFRLEP